MPNLILYFSNGKEIALIAPIFNSKLFSTKLLDIPLYKYTNNLKKFLGAFYPHTSLKTPCLSIF